MAKSQIMLQPVLQFLDNAGNVLNGGKLYFYSPSTTSPKNTYTDITKGTPNPNPIVLDSSGRPSNSSTPINIWLDGSYKLVLQDADSNVIRTIDPVNTLGQLVSCLEVSANTSVTEANRDQFIVVDASSGDITLTVSSATTLGNGFQFAVKKIDDSVNTITIQFNGSETADGSNTVVLNTQYQNQAFTCDGTQFLINSIVAPNLSVATITSTTINAGNLTLNGNTLSSTNTSGNINLTPNVSSGGSPVAGNVNIVDGNLIMVAGAINQFQGTAIASATTTNIGAGNGNLLSITGTTSITAFDTVQAGTRRTLIFAGILTLTNGVALTLPASKNITTAAGDVAEMVSLGSGNWKCLSYTPAALRSFIAINYQTFTAGSATYTPTPGTVGAEIEILGAGGGGGGFLGAGGFTGSSGGGGAGAYLKFFATAAQIGTSQALTIGAGGAGGASGNNNGSNGNSTVFGTLATVTGGHGGSGCTVSSTSAAVAGGTGGTATLTTGTPINGAGGNTGGTGMSLGGTIGNISGAGASGQKGQGGISAVLAGAGVSGSGFGAGGSGACGSSSSAAGGAGLDGSIIVKEYITI